MDKPDDWTDSEFDDIVEMGGMVYEYAEKLFSYGFKEDFCIQTVGNVAVFGGVNRLIWHPFKGFWVDPFYCTEDFITMMERHGVHKLVDRLVPL